MISQNGIDFIKRWEALRLVAYLDSGGVWTNGYGHTRNVTPGQVCTPEQALAWLREDVHDADQAVGFHADVIPFQSQHDALVSFVFNVGPTAFAKSTLLKKLNMGDYAGAAEQFKRWNKVKGKVVQGLVNRRESERVLFTLGDYNG